MNAIRLPIFLALAVASLVPMQRPAIAAIHQFESFLDGLQETPPVATPGTGFATMTLDDVSNQFTLTGTFQGLIGTSNNAHVHGPAAIGEGPAGVLFGISFDAGVTSGNMSFNGIISNAHKQTILDGLAYINLHSTFRPGGEIRGQVQFIPEPVSWGLCALAGVALLLRRRRRSTGS
jgi:hypothetical protein